MAKLTIVFGALISLVGVAGYVETHFWHALIPVVLGLLLVGLGLLANTPQQKQRMLAMHVAVTVGLLGFLGTLPGLIALPGYLSGNHEPSVAERVHAGVLTGHKTAAELQSVVSILCLIFVLLCVRSFIAARRTRAA